MVFSRRPRLFVEHPDVFLSVIISMYFGNIVLVILNLPPIPYISKLAKWRTKYNVPRHHFIFFSITGVYLVSFNTMDVFVMLICGNGGDSVKAGQLPARTVTAWLHIRWFDGRELETRTDDQWWWTQLPFGERPITMTFTILAVLVLSSPPFWLSCSRAFRAKPVEV